MSWKTIHAQSRYSKVWEGYNPSSHRSYFVLKEFGASPCLLSLRAHSFGTFASLTTWERVRMRFPMANPGGWEWWSSSCILGLLALSWTSISPLTYFHLFNLTCMSLLLNDNSWTTASRRFWSTSKLCKSSMCSISQIVILPRTCLRGNTPTTKLWFAS